MRYQRDGLVNDNGDLGAESGVDVRHFGHVAEPNERCRRSRNPQTNMDSRKPPEYTLELSADRSNVKDVIKGESEISWRTFLDSRSRLGGILHTIFFHRIFSTLRPATHDVLDTTLPYVSEDDVEDLIEQRINAFIRQVESTSTQQSPQSQTKTGRGQLVLQFLEKKRRKGWFVAKADEETVWENWILDITLTTARSEPEATRNRKQMEQQLQNAAMKTVMIMNRDRSHIPPITTTETNPFPYQILVNPKSDGWGQKIGIL